jgi:hypothetical protein
MAKADKLPLSPMLVQYLVGLCTLRWDGDAADIDVTLGDMVLDEAAETTRDVDVTVAVNAADGVHAFKGYEVKHWSDALDVSDVEALVAKLLDMPTVTHRGIVSTSGYSEAAIKKAAHHGVDLYTLGEWTKPLEEQFPHLAPMVGNPSEVLRGAQFALTWIGTDYWMGVVPAAPDFRVAADSPLFDVDGNQHALYRRFDELCEVITPRSAGELMKLQPITAKLEPLRAALEVGDSSAQEPQWAHAHTLDIGGDGVYVKLGNQLYLIDTFTIIGDLKWVVSPLIYRVMEKVPTGEPFAGAVIASGGAPGQMLALIFSSAPDRLYDVRFVQLDKSQLNSIRKLKIALSD